MIFTVNELVTLLRSAVNVQNEKAEVNDPAFLTMSVKEIMLIGGIPMAIKMLVFDYRENEKEFFRKKELENFDITFFEESLNDETIKEIPQDILDNGAVISVFVNSEVTENVINSFKNLRIISTRSTGVEHINLRAAEEKNIADRKSTRLNSSHWNKSRMPSSA